mmetsp:Transcript_25383/g.71010  ORF Transcript_25383/g.71010 Transcript_25383/m.71010 type:complete len:122 (+) Transcript_25383:198-563(+)|eukprot:CAMPEP_0117684236 /NCGR_PEP_ID=MMETSP0804-20121206/20957_1 /TAXON_ID=1074897 /ORGANISM="Tetraselmis astigmatica, Strain CCMP880" /LENGTH=121 /DNA_ID=CAMNT_0005495145 /DNA_START=188 /DNA_END=553 /DNA_ORIENTATION=+
MAPTKLKRGTLDVTRDQKGLSKRPAVYGAMVLIAVFFGAFMYGVSLVGGFHTNRKNFILPMLFPMMGVLFFACVMPLFVFVVYADDFEGINPLIPTHYIFIWKKTWKGFESGNWKLTAKEL